MKQTDPQYKLRLPPALKEQIEASAKNSGRSMNAEIVARLSESLTSTPATVPSADSIVKELEFVRHAYDRQVQSLQFGQELLAHYLLGVADLLPQEVTNAPLFAAALALADGVKNKDVGKIVDGYTALFPDLAGTSPIEELRSLDAARKRGEVTTDFVRRHVEDTRAKWLAEQDASRAPDRDSEAEATPASAPQRRRRSPRPFNPK